jgi:hypothetical protein
MTEQVPTPNSTPPEEHTFELEARNLGPTTAQGEARISRRFGEECLRWPERSVNRFPRRAADSRSPALGSSRRALTWPLADVDPPDRNRWSLAAIRRRPAIPRGHGPPAGD